MGLRAVLSSLGGGHRLPSARLVGKLLEGLMEHEPALKKLLDGWSSCWLSVQKERRDLQEKAKNLFLQKQIAKAIAVVLGPVVYAPTEPGLAYEIDWELMEREKVEVVR